MNSHNTQGVSPVALQTLEQRAFATDSNDEHLRTDHLLHNLDQRAVSSGAITAAVQVAGFFLNLGSAVVLARLLSPAEFGLVGMVGAVTAVLGILKEAGLTTATVQAETITQEQVSSLFWINAGLSGIVGLVAAGSAPLVARFYHDERLVMIMVALSLTFPFTGLTVQQHALLTRQMRFKAIGAIETAALLISLATGISLAWFGFGYWSLVGLQLSSTASALVLTWSVSGWRPNRPTRHSDVASLVTFGMHLSAADLIGRLSTRTDSILIGRFFGAEDLGLYSRANVLLARPLAQLFWPVSSVLTPVLARLQSDPARYRETFTRAYDALALLTFPFTALCLALAEPLVLVLLGPEWKGAIPLFAGFALTALALPLTLTASWLLTSQGRGRDLLHTYVVTSVATLVAYAVGLRWGPLGVILAFGAAQFLFILPILSYVAGRLGPVRTSDLWRGFFAHLPCWGAVFASASFARTVVGDEQPLVQLLMCTPVGLLAGAGMVLALERPRQSAFHGWKMLRCTLFA